MFHKHGRAKFCSILDKYWSRFASSWDVLLHGSPAVDIYGGLKLAAGGELGMGVGEEEWGSSERDVLEDFARRTSGLVDVMVSRFGEASPLQQAKTSTDPKTLEVSELEPWIGAGKNVHAADGVVFSGLGAVSRKSLRDLSHWVETIYAHGEYAYGVRDNPTSDRRKRRRRNLKPEPEPEPEEPSPPLREERPHLPTSSNGSTLPPGIPPPIVRAAETSLDKAAAAVENKSQADSTVPESKPMLASLGDTETWMKYMTLGYGTAWGGKKSVETSEPAAPVPAPSAPPARERTPSPAAMRYVDPTPDVDPTEEKMKQQIRLENDGYFLVGLKGDLQDLETDDENGEGDWNIRIPLRTIHVEVDKREASLKTEDGDSDETPQYERDMRVQSNAANDLSRLRPVVYVVSRDILDRPLISTNTHHSIVHSSTPSSSNTARTPSALHPSTATSTTFSPPSTAPLTKAPPLRSSPHVSTPSPTTTQQKPQPAAQAPTPGPTRKPSTTSSTTPAPTLYTPASPTSPTQAPFSPKA
jgi:hypothetical protein